MTTTSTHSPKKSPMTSAQMTVVTSETRSPEMNLLKEALSRARMRTPQNEASRSARRVAMQARRVQARELGDVSQSLLR